MKVILIILAFPLLSFGQYEPNEKLAAKTGIVTNSGRISGYLVSSTDSVIVLSSTKRYDAGSVFTVPVNTIRQLNIKKKNETGVGGASLAFVFGFTITAGLTKNGGDFDNDGKTSFFELFLTAIEGTTSSNRRRRNTALIVGGAGGVAVLLAYLLDNNKLSLKFPLSNRNSFYSERRHELNSYIKF